NKMKGMGQIVTYSIRDESLHIQAMIKLFHTLLDEYPSVWEPSLRLSIYEACKDMVKLEKEFVRLAFKDLSIEGLTSEEVYSYVEYIADRRLLQLGLEPLYSQANNPLGWLVKVLNSVEHTNFFENRATEYSKGNLKGNWSE